MIKYLINTSLFLLLATVGMAQHKLEFTLLDGHTKKPIEHATVALGNLQGETNSLGRLTFTQVRQGKIPLKIGHLAYKTYLKHLTIQQDQQFTISLDPQNIRTEEIFVQATRAKNNAATSFKNITKEDIKKNNLGQDIPYLLDQTPSVVISSDAGAGIGYTKMSIRGTDATRINVTLNGIPLNNSESMGSFFVNLPDFASSVENIQVQRGVGTSTNGAGAFGGSLNLQTETLAEKPYAALNNSVGSYNTWKNTVKVGTGLLQNKFALNARLSNISSDGYIDRSSSKLQSYYLDASYYGKNQILKATIFSGKEKTYQAWNGVPESYLATNRTFNEFTYKNQTDNYTQTHYHLHYSNQLNATWDFNTALHYTRGAGYYEEYKEKDELSSYNIDPVIFGKDTITQSNIIRQRALANDFYGMTFALNYKAPKYLKATLGGAYNNYLGDHYGQVIWAEYASNSFPTKNYYFNDAQKEEFNTFLKVDYTKTKFALYADLQYRGIDYTFQGLNRLQQETDQRVKHHFFNPKVGATYFINTQANIYLSWALAHKEPTRDDYTEAIFEERPLAEQLQDIELGYRLRTKSFQLGANVYGMFYKNQLILTGKINNVGAYLKSNVPDSYRIGLELDAAWQISPKVVWKATATFSENKIKNFIEYVGKEDQPGEVAFSYDKTTISMSPSAILSNEISYRPLHELEFSILSKYVSRQYLDNSQSKERSIQDYMVHNLRVNYNFAALGMENIGLSLLVNNLLNKKYESSGYTFGSIAADQSRNSYNYYYPQATTNFLLGLNIRF